MKYCAWISLSVHTHIVGDADGRQSFPTKSRIPHCVWASGSGTWFTFSFRFRFSYEVMLLGKARRGAFGESAHYRSCVWGRRNKIHRQTATAATVFLKIKRTKGWWMVDGWWLGAPSSGAVTPPAPRPPPPCIQKIVKIRSRSIEFAERSLRRISVKWFRPRNK